MLLATRSTLGAASADGTDDFGKGGFATVGEMLLDPSWPERYSANFPDRPRLPKGNEALDLPAGVRLIKWSKQNLKQRDLWTWAKVDSGRNAFCWAWGRKNISWKTSCNHQAYLLQSAGHIPVGLVYDTRGALWSMFFTAHPADRENGIYVLRKGRPYQMTTGEQAQATVDAFAQNPYVQTTCGLLSATDPKIGKLCQLIDAAGSSAPVPPPPATTIVKGMTLYKAPYPAGSVARFNTSRGMWSIYAPAKSLSGGLGRAFGVATPQEVKVTPAPPPGTEKVGETTEKPASVPDAGKERDKKWFDYPQAWLGISAVLGGGSYYLWQRGRSR